MIRELAAKLRGIVGRAVITAVDDAAKAQLLTLKERDDEEEFDQIEHAQPFGLSFRPSVGAEVILVSPDGESANQVAICAQDRTKRPAVDVAEGEGGLYLEGVYRVFLAADGTVHLGEQEGADFVALAAKVDAELSALKTAYDMHTHPHSMGPTGPVTVPLVPFNAVGATKVKAT